MLIRCPECEVCYRIELEMIPEKGRRFRCAKCGKVWQAFPQDAFEETEENASLVYNPETDDTGPEAVELSGEVDENDSSGEEQAETVSAEEPADEEEQSSAETEKSEEPADEEEQSSAETEKSEEPEEAKSENSKVSNEIQEIFSRLNAQTTLINDMDKQVPAPKRLARRVSDFLNWRNPYSRYGLLGVAGVIFVLAFFSFRYEITRMIPVMENIYNLLGVESKIIGEGLDFRNVVRREYEEDYVRKLEVKGFIVNQTEQNLPVPLIYIEVLDKDGNILEVQKAKSPVEEVSPDKPAPFSFVLNQPSPLSKYIYITFTAADEEK